MDRWGTCSFFQIDPLGGTCAVADDAGSIGERVDHDPFGRPVFAAGGTESTLGNPTCSFADAMTPM
jgi:hypothetical protein